MGHFIDILSTHDEKPCDLAPHEVEEVFQLLSQAQPHVEESGSDRDQTIREGLTTINQGLERISDLGSRILRLKL